MLHIHDCSEMLRDVKQIGLCAILCNDENITISCLSTPHGSSVLALR